MPFGRDVLRSVPPDKRCAKCKKNKPMMNSPLCALCAMAEKAGKKK